MATLRYRRNRKKWEVDYRRHGKRFRQCFSSKQTATEYRRKIEELIERERAGLGVVELVNFRTFGEIFIENHLANKSLQYQRVSAAHIRNMFNKHFGTRGMTEITHGDISQFVALRETQGVSPKTIQNDMLLLHVMFRAAIKNGYASENPVKDVETPKPVPRRTRFAVPDADLIKALRNMKPEELMIVLLLRNTGMRLGELYHLQYDDVNFEQHTIRIQSVLGATTKNYQSRETILTPTAAKILAMLGRRSPFMPIGVATFQDRLLSLKRKHGSTWDAHCLRHTFITRLRYANIPERVVAHYVGHSQKSITDHYTSYTPEFVEASIAAADFGMEFLNLPADVLFLTPKTPRPEVVVSKWSPEIGSSLQVSGIVGGNSSISVGRAGVEPATR